MNSTITIDDTDEEVIDLESSQDTINVTDNEHSEYSIEKNSLPNSDANKTDVASDNVNSGDITFQTKTCDNASTSKSLFMVRFRDQNISRQYSKKIKEFLKELISSEIRSQESDNGLTLEIWDNNNDNDNDNKNDSTSQFEITTGSEDSQDIICNTLFTVDTHPKLNSDLDIPTYGKKYGNDVFDKTKSVSDDKSKAAPPRMTCFNCLGNHNLRDCTKPRNYVNIDTNRKCFMMKGNNKTVRYHLEDNQKFSHMTPGQLSSNLRKALGLRDNELPKHIYRMRDYGYPPAWLEEARLQHSGLSLFNSDGVAEHDPDDEPGAIFEDGDKDQYDINKIYDFPGFNVPAPPGTHDEHGSFWATAMLDVHSKQKMLLTLKGKKTDEGYKRKKLRLCNNTLRDDPTPEPSEMEIEDVEESIVECVPTNGLFVPPLPLESPVKPPEPTSQPLSQDSDYHSQEILAPSPLQKNFDSPLRTSSPSLTELEDMKKQLLVELQESNSAKNNLEPKSNVPLSSNEATPEAKHTKNGANTSRGSIKSIDLGTPVLLSKSPYNKLPPSEKFSKNICDVINFENLPDSTGKYEQMTGVLQKVRNTMAKLQQE